MERLKNIKQIVTNRYTFHGAKEKYKLYTLFPLTVPAPVVCTGNRKSPLLCFSGIRAFANSFADYELTQKTDNYIIIHMDEIVKGPQTISLPYLQVDVFGRCTRKLVMWPFPVNRSM